MLAPELLDTEKQLDQQIEDVLRKIHDQQNRQRLLRDSTQSARTTIGQLVDILKLGLERGTSFTEEQQAAFLKAQQLFLENQRRDQELSESLAELNEQLVESPGSTADARKEAWNSTRTD